MAKEKQKQDKTKKKKKTVTPNARLLVVFDRSGSMQSMWAEAVNGFENFVRDQQKVPGKAWLTTAMFDSPGAPLFVGGHFMNGVFVPGADVTNDPGYHLAHDNVPLKDANPARVRDFPPRNATALYDAIGRTVNDALSKKVARGTRTMLVIITDGAENSSKEYTHQAVTSLIKRVQEEHKWEVIFLGANIDAKSTAFGLGIMRSKAATFDNSGVGATTMASTVNMMATNYRCAVGDAGLQAYATMDVADVYESEKKKVETTSQSKTS